MENSEQDQSAVPHRFLTFLVAGVLFMEFLDGTVITTALPAMARSFSADPVDLNVGISAYLFALGVFIPISGWMVERFGGRAVFMSAIAIFTGASLLCGLADNLPVFVAVRVLQGFGGAMMVPVGRLLVLQNTPKDRLIAVTATLVWPALVAPVIGPALGGFITTYADWRWIFFLNLPLGALALRAAAAWTPAGRGHNPPPFDWMGFFLSAAGISLFLYGAERVSRLGEGLERALPALIGGAVLLVVTIIHLKRAKAPMIRLEAMKVPTFAAAMRGGSLSRAAIGSAPFLLPLMFQLGFGWTAFRAGLVVMALFAGNLLMKSMTTPLLKRFGFRPILLYNGLLCAASLGACAFFHAATPLAVVLLVLFLSGLTRSMHFTTLSSIAFADVPKAEVGPANVLFSTLFQLSLGGGVAMGAIALRLGGVIAKATGDFTPAADYRFAFALVAAIALISLTEALWLEPGAGAHLIRPGGQQAGPARNNAA